MPTLLCQVENFLSFANRLFHAPRCIMIQIAVSKYWKTSLVAKV